MRIILILTLTFSVFSDSFAQNKDTVQEVIWYDGLPPDKKKVWLVAGTHAAIWTGSYIALNKAWYANYPKSDFHFFNDFREWNQMDKAGHVWTAYQINRGSSEMWKWAGLSDKKSTIYGAIASTAYQAMIEVQDGFSEQWGFSWSDMAANLAGTGAYTVQQLTWKEQRISIKMSYQRPKYPADLIERRNNLYGEGTAERILKDYNGQTYWASFNIKSFAKQSNWPEWLNIAAGYGADGILGGFENSWKDKDGNTITRHDIIRKRQYYLSPDIDFTKIKTNSKLLKTVFFVLNAVKVPAPALMIDSKGKFRGYVLYF